MWLVKRANTKTSLAQVNAQIVKTTQIPLLQAPLKMIVYAILDIISRMSVLIYQPNTITVLHGMIHMYVPTPTHAMTMNS